MAFCSNCGSKLSEGVAFCEQCGAAVEMEPSKGSYDDLYATFDGREVTVYHANGCAHRHFYMTSEVEAAYVSGDTVSITCEDGFLYIYHVDGYMIRRIRR